MTSAIKSFMYDSDVLYKHPRPSASNRKGRGYEKYIYFLYFWIIQGGNL